MLQHVLVPLDGSSLAEEALAYARQIVGAGAKITLLTVVDIPEYPIYYYYPAPMVSRDMESAETKDLLKQASEYLEKMAATLQSDEITVRIEAQVGQSAPVIVETAAKDQVDAIVMSTHGRSGLGRWLFGSVTNKVLETASCPVFVIPGKKLQQLRKERALNGVAAD